MTNIDTKKKTFSPRDESNGGMIEFFYSGNNYMWRLRCNISAMVAISCEEMENVCYGNNQLWRDGKMFAMVTTKCGKMFAMVTTKMWKKSPQKKQRIPEDGKSTQKEKVTNN